jgi:hypothetical protein
MRITNKNAIYSLNEKNLEFEHLKEELEWNIKERKIIEEQLEQREN